MTGISGSLQLSKLRNQFDRRGMIIIICFHAQFSVSLYMCVCVSVFLLSPIISMFGTIDYSLHPEEKVQEHETEDQARKSHGERQESAPHLHRAPQ